MFGLSVQDLITLVPALLVAGVATGLLAGLFGVGGGAVMVPVLDVVFQFLHVDDAVRMHLCVGTSLAVIVPTSIQSFRTHWAKGHVLKEALQLWALPIVVSVILGAWVASFASATLLRVVFAVVAMVIAEKLLFGHAKLRLGDQLPSAWVMRFYGGVIGLASSLMGIGGGSLSNMVFSFYNVSIHRSVATSSGVGVLISLPGALGYMIAGWSKMALLPPFSLGYVSFLGFILIAPLASLVAPFGARLAHALSKRHLEICFGVFLALVSLRFFATLLG